MPHDRSEHVGWPTKYIQGAVIETDGAGRVSTEIVSEEHWRGADMVQRIEGISRSLKQAMVFFFCAHDADFWTVVQPPEFAASRAMMNKLLDECPNTFLLSWNPCGMDPSTGRLGRATVAIPDVHPMEMRPNVGALPPVEKREPLIAWRGKSTGYRPGPGRYKESDRWKAVNAFQEMPGQTDVKFTERCQDVNRDEVPDSMMGSSMGYEQLLKTTLQLDVDGNVNAWEALRWKLTGSGVIFKAWSTRGCTQWYYPEMTHDKEVHVFDVNAPIDEIRAEAWSLVRNTQLASKLSSNARKFAEKTFFNGAPHKYLEWTLRLLQDDPSKILDRDWRIRSVPSSVLSRYSVFGLSDAESPAPVALPPPPTVVPGTSVPGTLTCSQPGSFQTDCAKKLMCLLRTAPHDRSEHVGWPTDVIQGVVIEADGNGEARRETVSNDKWRGEQLVSRIVEYSARQRGKKPTVFYFCAHDADFWTVVQPPEFEGTRSLMNKLLDECPNIFLLSWNPCGMDPATGRLGRATIAIPDVHPMEIYTGSDVPPVDRRNPLIAWRGKSTGYRPGPGRYKESDRWKAVNAFQEMPGQTDVKFTERCQAVDTKEVPDSMMGNSMGYGALLNTRLQLDVDGNVNAWEALRWKLTGSGVIFKAWSTRGCTQWYYPEMTHDKEVHVFDVNAPIDEIRAEAIALSQNIDLCTKLSESAADFASRAFFRSAPTQFLDDVLGKLFDNSANKLLERDWRIRRVPERILKRYTIFGLKPDETPAPIALPTPVPPTAPPTLTLDCNVSSSQLQSACARKLLCLLRTAPRHEDPAKRILQGLVMEANGLGNVSIEQIVPPQQGSRQPMDQILRLRRAAAALRQSMIFFYSIDDADFWTQVEGDKHNATRALMNKLLDECPNIFLLSWNPCGMDPATGRLGRATIPIPDPSPMEITPNVNSIPPVEKREPLIAWRGKSTGYRPGPGRYKESDRWKAVNAFQEMPGQTDVKFTDRVQEVNTDEVPDSMMGLAMGYEHLLKTTLQLDVDGNANSWDGLRWKLTGSGVIFKAWSTRGCTQWYYPMMTHDKEVHVFDVNAPIDEIRAEAIALVNNISLASTLGRNARNLAERNFFRGAPNRYVDSLFQLLEANRTAVLDRDWRIRGVPRRILKRYVKYGLAPGETAAPAELPTLPPPTTAVPRTFAPASTECSEPGAFETDCAKKLLCLLRTAPHDRSEHVGWPTDVIQGVVIEADGNGNVRRETVSNDKWRGEEAVSLIVDYSKQLKGKASTVFFFCAHDADFWTTVQPPEYNATRAMMNKLLDECPIIFLLSWNPCGMDPATGRLGRATIAIPDVHPMEIVPDLQNIRPVESREPLIAWRGKTTGYRPSPGRYRESDRWKAVNAFQEMPGQTDVKFTERCQDVNRDEVPDSMMGSSMGYEHLLKTTLQLDVDGNVNAWEALRWKLTGSGVVFKAWSTRGCTQWYYPEMTHDKEVHVFDVNAPIDEIRAEAISLVNNHSLSRNLSSAAVAFAQRIFLGGAPQRYLRATLDTVFSRQSHLAESSNATLPPPPSPPAPDTGTITLKVSIKVNARPKTESSEQQVLESLPELLNRDWRIKGVPARILRRYSKYGLAPGETPAPIALPPPPPPVTHAPKHPKLDCSFPGQFTLDCAKKLMCLLRTAPHDQSEHVGWPTEVIQGVVIEALASGSTRREVVSSEHWRGGEIVDRIENIAKHLKKDTVFFFCAHDADFWTVVQPPQFEESRAIMNKLLDECPNIFLLSWNPCGMDPATGRLGRATIAIPDVHPMEMRASPHDAPRVANRQPVIAWRGKTTGYQAPDSLRYQASDRYKAVRAFQDMPGEADVKFSERCQAVSDKEVPNSMMGSKLHGPSLLKTMLQMDADGNVNAWEGLRWKLTGSGVVFKAWSTRGCTQWYYPEMTHDKEVHVFDVNANITDLQAEARGLSKNIKQCQILSDSAAAFASKHFFRGAPWGYLENTLRSLWDSKAGNPKKLLEKDWRIKGVPAKILDRYQRWELKKTAGQAEGEETKAREESTQTASRTVEVQRIESAADGSTPAVEPIENRGRRNIERSDPAAEDVALRVQKGGLANSSFLPEEGRNSSKPTNGTLTPTTTAASTNVTTKSMPNATTPVVMNLTQSIPNATMNVTATTPTNTTAASTGTV